jgi:hypothetical protein
VESLLQDLIEAIQGQMESQLALAESLNQLAASNMALVQAMIEAEGDDPDAASVTYMDGSAVG